MVVDHQAFQCQNVQFKRCVIQQQGRIDVELDAGCKAHHCHQFSLFFFRRNQREMRLEVDFLLALLGLFDDLDFLLVKEGSELFF